MATGHRLTTLGLAVGLGLGPLIGLSCNDDSEGNVCTPGQLLACPCGDGSNGLQSCLQDGSAYGPCDCDDPTEGGTAPTGPATETGSSSGSDPTGDPCGNGIEDPGECAMGDPAYCPDDCAADDTTTGLGECVDEGPIYVTLVPPTPSRWESGALVGFAAGQQLCRDAALAAGAPDPGMVTVCTYLQMIQAELAGELAAVPMGTSAWVHRITAADVMGMPSAPGIGGRCADWTTLSNDLSDGEHAEFLGGGMIDYFLDDDTSYDGVDTSHTQPGLLECGMQMRSILCCNPSCPP